MNSLFLRQLLPNLRMTVAACFLAALVVATLLMPGGSGSAQQIALDSGSLVAPGDLDPTFGDGGKVATSFPGGLDTASAVAIQADGKIVVGGSSGTDFALTRYNPNGSLDPTFGLGGRVNTDFRVNMGGTASAMVLQPDGKIVMAGSGSDPTPGSFNSVFALARYNTDGSLDTTFDGDGLVTTLFPGASASARGVALQSDGRLIVIGAASDSITFQSVFALARYNINGSLDTTFDGDGRVTTDVPGLTFEEGHGVAVQANGKIVAVGLGNASFVVIRYNANGSVDSGGVNDSTPGDQFGNAGIATTQFGGTFEEANSVAIQSDQKIVVAGATARSVAADDNFALARYNVNGSLDTSFDGDGRVITDFGLVDAAEALVIQPDGRVLGAGRAGTIPLGSFFALSRYNSNGSLDTTFDGDGKALTDMSGGRFGLGASGVALQADGKIVAAGDSNASGQRDFGIVRYGATGPLDATFDGDGKVVTDFALNEDSISRLLLQPDGKIVAVGYNNHRVRLNQAQDPNFQLARYNTNGTLDPTFGNGGLVSTDFLNHGDDAAYAAIMQPDGKIVVVGETGPQFSAFNGDSKFAVARYNPNGTLDTTFDSDGLATVDIGATTDRATAVALQSDGRIIIGGRAGSNPGDLVLVRLNPDGSFDSGGIGDTTPGDSFGTSGKTVTDVPVGSATLSSLLVQSGDLIVAGGSVLTSQSSFADGRFLLVRYTAAGMLDSTFGAAGMATTDLSSASDGVTDLVKQPADGRIIAVGFSNQNNTTSDFAVARYSSEGVLERHLVPAARSRSIWAATMPPQVRRSRLTGK